MNEITEKCIKCIGNYFKNTLGKTAIIGISGGKDSSVVAALCVEALGKENVIGVLMPNEEQKDIEDSNKICDFLGIKKYEMNIGEIFGHFWNELSENNITVTNQAKFNLPPRIRMSLLYFISQSIDGGRVMNTTNACERFVGYGTLFGDTAGDFAPLKYLTVDEIYEIGNDLNIPKELLYKTPSDGLTGKSDEEVLGVSYSDIGKFYKDFRKYGWEHAYLKMEEEMDKETFEKIINLNYKNKFKSDMINVPGVEFY